MGGTWGYRDGGHGGQGKGSKGESRGGRAVVEHSPMRMRAEVDGAALTGSCVQLGRVLGDGRRAGGEVGAMGWRQNGKFGRNGVQNLIRRWKRSEVEREM